jgi:uncharacterized membrane protein (UPF0127 family)
MMRLCARILGICLLALLLSGQGGEDSSLAEAFTQDVFVIEASEHACYRFDIYLALTREQQRRGLMFVRELPPFSGMLFVYQRTDILSMWMKNTYIPLDMLFIRADGTVSSVMANTEPLSLRSISSTEPVNYVLELNAGVAARLSIDSRSRLILDAPQQ